MIYTVTCNPSLDYNISLDGFQTGKTNRTDVELVVPGGKGINVSRMLRNLGVESTALGFLAGFTGREIQRRTNACRVFGDWIFLEEGNSRINIKLHGTSKTPSGEISDLYGTEINGKGPDVPLDARDRLRERIALLQKGDVLVLAGSVPASVSPFFYADLLRQVEGRHVLTVVDAAGSLLCSALLQHPFLIKPNAQELAELFQTPIHTREEALFFARRLQAMGARNVLVSLAGQGAVLAAEDNTAYSAKAPQGQLVNAVGAGDSMVAGFLAGWMESESYAHAFRMGLAAGSASAFSEQFATKADVQDLLEKIPERVEVLPLSDLS